MITTVTLNPCLNNILYLDSLKPGSSNTVLKSRLKIYGNGLNVSEVLRALGLSTFCLGIISGEDRELFSRYLDERCVAHDFVQSKGRTRTGITLVSADGGEITEINNPGESAGSAVVEAYLKKLEYYAGRSSVIAFCGRVPYGGDAENHDGVYRRSLETVKSYDIITAVDAEYGPLKLAVPAKPYLIKLTLCALEAAFGCKSHSKRDIVDACRDIIKKGVAVVCCIWDDGAVIADKDSAFFAPRINNAATDPQGAEDSLMAGLLCGLRKKMESGDILRCGVAAAAGTATRESARLCRRQNYEAMLKRVIIEAI